MPTGYGKSLIFQCLPIPADALLDKPRSSSLVVVISPLRSLMEDQEDPDIVQQVINGNYIVVEENSQVPQFLPFLLPMHPHCSPTTLLLSLLSRRYFLTRILLVLFGWEVRDAFLVSQHTVCIYSPTIYLLSRGESSRLSISARMSKSLLHLSKISRSYLFSMSRKHKQQLTCESDIRYSGIHMPIQWTISEYICISLVVTKSRVMILRDHWTNHKLRKKQANQKRLHMSVRLCGIRTCVVVH